MESQPTKNGYNLPKKLLNCHWCALKGSEVLEKDIDSYSLATQILKEVKFTPIGAELIHFDHIWNIIQRFNLTKSHSTCTQKLYFQPPNQFFSPVQHSQRLLFLDRSNNLATISIKGEIDIKIEYNVSHQGKKNKGQGWAWSEFVKVRFFQL